MMLLSFFFLSLRTGRDQADMTFYKTSNHLPYRTGGRYQGEWKADKKNGYGTKTWVSGNKYEGEWVWDKRHGKGTYWVTQDGKLRKQYAGGWKDNMKDGLGVFYFSDGGKYDGEWQDNKCNGRGRMNYANGEVYDGSWLAGGRSGMGTLYLPNGDIYEGQWLFDKKEGPGRFLYLSTRKIYEGEWVDGMPKCGEFKNMPEDILSEVFSCFDFSKGGLVAASALPSILDEVKLSIGADKVQHLLNELQADPDTAISFPEFIDIVSLLMS